MPQESRVHTQRQSLDGTDLALLCVSRISHAFFAVAAHIGTGPVFGLNLSAGRLRERGVVGRGEVDPNRGVAPIRPVTNMPLADLVAGNEFV
jgi:hypothetical protein